MGSWFKEEIFLIPNWAWFVIIVGIFCILMAIVIVTCVKKGDGQDENPEPVLMEGEEANDGGDKKEEVAALEKADEPKADEPKTEDKQEKVVYTEPEPVLVEEPVQPIKEEKPAKNKPKKATEKSENKEEKADNKPAEKKSAKPKTAAAKPATAKSEKTAEKKPAAKSTASKPASAKSEKTAAKPAATKPAAKSAKSDDDKVYHISKRKEENKWQVKAEGSAKALKLFLTQEEAIDYAKSVAGNQEGRIVIHKEDGGFRKLKY